MLALQVLLFCLGTSQALFLREKPGRLTVYSRRDDNPGDFFPWPANKSSIVDASTEPFGALPSVPSANDIARPNGGQIPRRFIEAKCDVDKKSKIVYAWTEAGQLADAQTNLQPGYEYNIPHTQWLGKDWNYEGNWYNYRKWIGDNFRRLNQLFSNNAQSGEYIYWYCYDYAGECDADTVAYSWDSEGYFWSNHYTVFCDQFYQAPTMSQQLTRHANIPKNQRIMENFHINRGQIMFHEIWHYHTLVSNPQTEDFSYQAQAVWELARDNGTAYSYVNADSYALDAVAIYVQQHYSNSMSPIPFKEYYKLDTDIQQPPDQKATSKSFNSTPPKWAGPLVIDDKPDLGIWEEITDSQVTTSSPPVSTQAASPVCTGSATKWAPRDPLSSVIPSFCADAEKQGVQDKNSGSIARTYLSGNDAVMLSIDWPSGNPWKPAKDDCIKYLAAVMDGCDTNSDGNNPMNWKHGGHLISGVARYNIIPQADRGYGPGTCAFHLHEEEYFQGVDGPGTERTHQFYLRDSVKDGAGSIVSTISNDVGFGDDKPYVCNSFYAPLRMTPEAQGDYIQFSIGSLSWTTKDSSGPGHCKVGGWDGRYSPVGRDMDCVFPC